MNNYFGSPEEVDQRRQENEHEVGAKAVKPSTVSEAPVKGMFVMHFHYILY